MSQTPDPREKLAPSIRVSDVVQVMERLAPGELSESWDNTGLLLGDPSERVLRLMTCLTLTAQSTREAIEGEANLVIAHHPLPFKPLSKITTDSIPGKLLWELARAGISVYSPHTSWDSAAEGINFQLASRLQLENISPLIDADRFAGENVGSGRYGSLPEPTDLATMARRAAAQIPNCRLRGVDSAPEIKTVAVACGSGGSFLAAAAKCHCQLLVTGEATFHNCLEAQAMGVSMLLLGHFASEKFAMAQLVNILRGELDQVEIWTSQREVDPVKVLG